MVRVLGVLVLAGDPGAGAPGAPAAVASPTARVRTDHGCYLVGRPVHFSGSAFAPSRAYDVTIDGVEFGQAQTDSSGGFQAHVVPGGLPAGSPQSVDQLEVTDGSSDATATFTVTRSAGARFLASGGEPRSLKAPFQTWGFSMQGAARTVFLHYVSPSGRGRETVQLGRTGGQCGYLVTRPMRVFPFSPSTGRWTLQVDTLAAYSSRPTGPVARISVRIARG